MATPHIEAKLGDIAEIVLMPGDPLRAKFIAENYLEEPVLFNTVRNMLGYTGYYKGKRISVMGSGMGIPSIGIYAYELYKFYDVKKIIRIGSCGAYSPDLKLYNLILVDKAYSESTFAYEFNGYKDKIIESTSDLNNKIETTAQFVNIPINKGNIMTSDVFYAELEQLKRAPTQYNIIAAEMEAFALFHLANFFAREASCLLSVARCFLNDDVISSVEREKALTKMIELSLESVLND
jgi:purine-nucleoside phosphorylase